MRVTGLGVRWGEGCRSLLNMLVLDMWEAEVVLCPGAISAHRS